MRTYETVTEPVERHRLVELRCDLCGTTRPGDKEWATERHQVATTEVRLKTGEDYPEGGTGEEVVFDICPDCFLTKLIPWMVGQGATVRRREWDF